MSTSITPNLDTISLYYKAGTSDKEYHLTIVGSEDKGYQVEYRYGKRGAKLTTKFKNPLPTDYKNAREIFERERDKQLREGYTTGESGTPYIGTENAGKVSGLLPQLLKFIDEAEVQKYLDDNNWIMQEKKDGVRCMIRKQGKTIEAINKKGLVVSLPETTEKAIRSACGKADATLDGELIGEIYWVFDLLSISVHAYANKPYSDRLAAITEWLDEDSREFFRLVPTAVGKASKKALYKKLKEEGAEGFVFKKADSVYKAGRNPDQVKFKFYASATVRVKEVNDKRSVQVEVLDKGDWTFVGNVTVPVDQPVPKAGQFIEVRYLYAYPGGSLFQPTCLGIRKDCDEGDCLKSQLKYKQGSQEDDDN